VLAASGSCRHRELEQFVRSPHLAAGYIGDEERTGDVMVNLFTNDPATGSIVPES
jgi:hypothetical protein